MYVLVTNSVANDNKVRHTRYRHTDTQRHRHTDTQTHSYTDTQRDGKNGSTLHKFSFFHSRVKSFSVSEIAATINNPFP